MPTPLTLATTVVLVVDTPLTAPTVTVTPLHVVAQSTPIPTLVDGRPL